MTGDITVHLSTGQVLKDPEEDEWPHLVQWLDDGYWFQVSSGEDAGAFWQVLREANRFAIEEGLDGGLKREFRTDPDQVLRMLQMWLNSRR